MLYIWSQVLHDLTVVTDKQRMNLGSVRIHKLILTKRNPENLTADCQSDPDRSQMEESPRTVETWHGRKHKDTRKEPCRMTGWNRLTTTTYIGRSESLRNNSRISRPANNTARTKRGSREKPVGPAPTSTPHHIPPHDITHHNTL